MNAEFEKWYASLYDASKWSMYHKEGLRVAWQAAEKATALRCREIAIEKHKIYVAENITVYVTECFIIADAITTEYKLGEKKP